MVKDWTQLVKDAQNGNQKALEDIISGIQDRIYHLAMRILVNPDDALDATQEILISIITKLSTFRHESSFNTWVYRVATNYLLNAKKIRERDPGLSFEIFRTDLESGLTQNPVADDIILLNELRISCTMAMLLCLDLNHRVAYVLGDVLELDHSEASEVLDISKDAFRKRLSRARKDIIQFTSQHCGIVNENAGCSCPRRLPTAIKLGRVNKNNLIHATKGSPDYQDVISLVKSVEGNLKALKMQQATRTYKSPRDFAQQLQQILSPKPMTSS